MNKYIIAIILFTIAYVVVTLIANGLGKEQKENKIKKSRRKGRHNTRESRYATNSVKKQLADALNEKANVNKRYKIETLCLQAGHNISYGEFVILKVTCALILPILIFILTKNIFLIIIFAIIGFNVPGQVMKTKSNKRRAIMEKQVGSFIRILLERYKVTKDMSQSMVQSLPDFRGHDPFYSTLKNSIADLKMGKPIEDTLDGLVRETGNRYLAKFTDYYKMTNSLATHNDKLDLLTQAYEQYNDNEKMKSALKEKISGPVKEAYVMVMAVPVFFFYQCFFSEGYLDFMLNDPIGQFGLAGSVGLLLGCIWFINVKIGAPIE